MNVFLQWKLGFYNCFFEAMNYRITITVFSLQSTLKKKQIYEKKLGTHDDSKPAKAFINFYVVADLY